MLLGSGDESIRRLHDASNDLRWRQPTALLHGFDQLRLAPLIVGRVHGFADAIRERDQYIVPRDGHDRLLVRKGFEQTHHRAASLKTRDLPPVPIAMKKHR